MIMFLYGVLAGVLGVACFLIVVTEKQRKVQERRQKRMRNGRQVR